MKKWLCLILAAAMLVSVLAVEANAEVGSIMETVTSENLIPAAISTFDSGVGTATHANLYYSGGNHVKSYSVVSEALRVTFQSWTSSGYIGAWWPLGSYIRELASANAADTYTINVSMDVKGTIEQAALKVRSDTVGASIYKSFTSKNVSSTEYTTYTGSFDLTYEEATAAADNAYALCLDGITSSGHYVDYDNVTLTITYLGTRENATLGWSSTGTNLIEYSTFSGTSGVPSEVTNPYGVSSWWIQNIGGDHGYVLRFQSTSAWNSPVWALGAKIRTFAQANPSSKYKLYVSVEVHNLSGGGVLCYFRNNTVSAPTIFSDTTDQWTGGSKSFTITREQALSLGDTDLQLCFDSLSAGYHDADNIYVYIYTQEELRGYEKGTGLFYTPFEEGSTADFAVNGCSKSASSTVVHDGDYSMYCSGRSNAYNSLYLTKATLDTVTGGIPGTYYVSEWIYLEDGADNIRLKAYNGSSVLSNLVAVPQATWTFCVFEITLTQEMLNNPSFQLYIADGGTTTKQYIDQFTIAGPVNKIQSANLELGSDLTINWFASIGPLRTDSSLVSMRFTRNGEKNVVPGVWNDETERFSFAYTGINPQCMSDEVTAELLYDETVLDTMTYSVKDYCDRMQAKTAGELGFTSAQYNAFRTLLADMLCYGAEAQNYRGYKTYSLANAGEWVSGCASSYVAPVDAKSATAPSGSDRISTAGMEFSNVNRVYFRITAAEAANSTVTLLRGENVVYNELAVSTLQVIDGKYVLFTDPITATGYGDVYTLTLKTGGTTVHQVTYSAYSYVANKAGSATIGALVQALCRYGTSATAFVDALS